MLSEKQQEKRQREAYEARESIMPGDVISLVVKEAHIRTSDKPRNDSDLIDVYVDVRFALRSGQTLYCENRMRMQAGTIVKCPFKAGMKVPIRCSKIMIGHNGYGLFVDYEFYSNELDHRVIINGPDAQALEVVKRSDWK